jgi:hypothetical protein
MLLPVQSGRHAKAHLLRHRQAARRAGHYNNIRSPGTPASVKIQIGHRDSTRIDKVIGDTIVGMAYLQRPADQPRHDRRSALILVIRDPVARSRLARRAVPRRAAQRQSRNHIGAMAVRRLLRRRPLERAATETLFGLWYPIVVAAARWHRLLFLPGRRLATSRPL